VTEDNSGTTPAIRTGPDDDGRRIQHLIRERKTLRQIADADDDARARIAEIDSELEELGVQRVAPLDGQPHGPEV
jgi:hypothetical protein